ncbi:MAG: Gfo/Idh/MocA family oxidoreductase [Candidatus Aminicenantes bacterium]|nr:Gfo/Idh/MocA family oxidoreductase [Candidatus Aminicenantes bacterium]
MGDSKISRRGFFRSVAAMAAAAAIVPSDVFGRQAPSNRINLAAIGVGNRGAGNVWADFVESQSDVRLVAACDCFAGRRNDFAAKVNAHYGAKICAPLADWREVLARKDVDGVVISTPDHWHVPIAYYAALAKKDLYVEKPLGVAMAWAWKLRNAAEANKIVFQYGTQQRSSAEFTRAVELVRNGYIGKIKHVDAWCSDMKSPGGYAEVFAERFKDVEPAPLPAGLDYEMWIGPAPMKPYTKTRCTEWGAYHIYDYALGFIAGWGAHPLDIAQWGLDMDHTGPVSYEGKGEIPQGGLFDTVENWDIRCRYANGVTMRFMSDRVAKDVPGLMDDPKKRPYMDHGTTFWGEGGWISVSRGALYASPKELQTVRIRDDEKPVIRSASQGRNFVESIRSRRPTINPLETAIRSDTISHLSDLVVRLGRPIRWDPDKERIIGDAEAEKKLDRPLRQPWKL